MKADLGLLGAVLPGDTASACLQIQHGEKPGLWDLSIRLRGFYCWLCARRGEVVASAVQGIAVTELQVLWGDAVGKE